MPNSLNSAREDSSQRHQGVAVVIPALNEEQSLPLVLNDLPAVEWVFVVDNGSTDQTARIAKANGAEVLYEPQRGYGRACLTGIREAQRVGADVLVILDGDHSDYPADLDRLLQPIEDGVADLVLGNRTTLAEPGALLPQQRIGNALATVLIRAWTGHRYQDMGPFRAIRATALSSLDMSDPTYGWNVEMQMKAVHAGLRIKEVDVRYRKRVGQSKISGTVRGTAKAGLKIMSATWRYR